VDIGLSDETVYLAQGIDFSALVVCLRQIAPHWMLYGIHCWQEYLQTRSRYII